MKSIFNQISPLRRPFDRFIPTRGIHLASFANIAMSLAEGTSIVFSRRVRSANTVKGLRFRRVSGRDGRARQSGAQSFVERSRHSHPYFQWQRQLYLGGCSHLRKCLLLLLVERCVRRIDTLISRASRPEPFTETTGLVQRKPNTHYQSSALSTATVAF